MSSAPPRIIRVTAAVIERDGKILCAQRPTGDSLAGLWEFPGGKIEPGEAPEACLRREIQEELGLGIQVGSLLCKTLHDYPGKTIELHVYLCRLEDQRQTPGRLESHQAIQWLSPRELPRLSWAPADLEAVRLLAKP
jgi:8-oxo-dGTP diphosphatase